jgi:hypothetical protein
MKPEEAKELLDVFRAGGFDAEPFDRESLLRAFLKAIERRAKENHWGFGGTATALSPTQKIQPGSWAGA